MYRGWKKTEWFTDVFAKELEEMNEIMESMIRNLGKEPGVQKEEIKINATEDEVIISTEGSGRKYYKSIKTKSMIDQDSARARYNNGVLEVTFKLKEAQKGKTVKIE